MSKWWFIFYILFETVAVYLSFTLTWSLFSQIAHSVFLGVWLTLLIVLGTSGGIK